MTIFDINKLNMVLNNLIIRPETEAAQKFFDLKDKLEDIITEHQEKYAELGMEYSITFNDEGELQSDDNEKVHEKLGQLVCFEYPLETNIFTQDEFFSLCSEGITGSDSSYSRKVLIK